MDIIAKAKELLPTDTYADLEPAQRALVDQAAAGTLPEAEVAQFEQLYADHRAGVYWFQAQWFHGQEHLTRDGQGYVYWKGKSVEHYSFRNRVDEAKAARKLAENCRRLEANGFPVNGRTAIHEECYMAPAGTPWMTALHRFYGFHEKDGQVIGLFHRMTADADPERMVAAYKDSTGIHLELHEEAYESFHYYQDRGYTSAGQARNYEDAVELLQSTGLTGEELHRIITATKSSEFLSVLYSAATQPA